MRISMDKEYQTKDGRSVKIVEIRTAGRYPVEALVTNPDGTRFYDCYTTGGRWHYGKSKIHDLDLVVKS